jgi:hypothetical protein
LENKEKDKREGQKGLMKKKLMKLDAKRKSRKDGPLKKEKKLGEKDGY